MVKKGDTLYSIAKKYNTTPEEIKRINNLSSDLLIPGQKIVINENIIPQIYIVQKGDTLYSISKKYNVTVDQIKNINNLNNNTITPGQEIIIPSENTPIIPILPPQEGPALPDNQDLDIYIVQKGDSLWLIAQKYDTTVTNLIELNRLSSINLKIGDKLFVPKKEEKMYIVKRGDTLWSISKENNISIDEIKRLNNLTSNLLSIGQQLKLQ